MTNNSDIFSTARPMGEFAKFKNIGDSYQGTYIDVRDGVDGYGNQQAIYVIHDKKSGKVWNVGVRKAPWLEFMHETMRNIRFGQIVGFRLDDIRPSKNNPGGTSKIIRIYSDPNIVDAEYVAGQVPVGGGDQPSVIPSQVVPGAGLTGANMTGVAAKPVQPNVPVSAAGPSDKVLESIRSLAFSKGLAQAGMSDAEVDKAVETAIGMQLTPDNYTQVVVALSTYTA